MKRFFRAGILATAIAFGAPTVSAADAKPKQAKHLVVKYPDVFDFSANYTVDTNVVGNRHLGDITWKIKARSSAGMARSSVVFKPSNFASSLLPDQYNGTHLIVSDNYYDSSRDRVKLGGYKFAVKGPEKYVSSTYYNRGKDSIDAVCKKAVGRYASRKSAKTVKCKYTPSNMDHPGLFAALGAVMNGSLEDRLEGSAFYEARSKKLTLEKIGTQSITSKGEKVHTTVYRVHNFDRLFGEKGIKLKVWLATEGLHTPERMELYGLEAGPITLPPIVLTKK
jgi:hypothetical protein